MVVKESKGLVGIDSALGLGESVVEVDAAEELVEDEVPAWVSVRGLVIEWK
jgi:hypothetical protein